MLARGEHHLRLPVQSLPERLGYTALLGRSQSLPVVPSANVPELRPLPSIGITRLLRYYGPLRHPARPGRLLTESRLRVPRPHRWGFPCCVRSPCADVPSPLPRRNRCGFSFCPPVLPVGASCAAMAAFPQSQRSASALVFSRLAQRSLTLRPAGSPGRLATLSIEGFGGFVASTTTPIATGWSESCQAGFSPAEDLRLSTAHGTYHRFLRAFLMRPGLPLLRSRPVTLSTLTSADISNPFSGDQTHHIPLRRATQVPFQLGASSLPRVAWR